MDNRRTIPGYKYYLDAATRLRPSVFVTFLSIRERAGAEVGGVAFEVEPAALAALDERERNYRREEVTGRLDAELPGPVLAYVGRDEARERFSRGRAFGRACVARRYFEAVRSLGDEFERTTDPLDVPVRDLIRVDVD
jgi:hypothetical protein